MEILNLVAVVGIVITSLALLVLENYRFSLAAMVLQYLFVFFLVSSIWPVGLAVVKLIVGWIVCSLIGSAYLQNRNLAIDESNTAKMFFSSLSAVVVWLIVFTISGSALAVLPITRPLMIAAGILLGMGLLQLGSTTNLLRIFLGLLTVLSGFEIIYAGLEESVLVTGLLAIVNILFGFMGWYMIQHNSHLESA
ncbi:MAG: hypothetical protein JEZ00_11765 [Anaerolineaceae bacterium]|nr:hypothetical protein [Anaerolineaceae bacterium]